MTNILDLNQAFSLEPYMDSIEFVLIKPDAVIRGLTLEIIRVLESNQIVPVDYRVVGLTADHIDRLYDTTKQKYDSWWIMEEAYSIAPSIALLVIGEKGEFTSVAEKVRYLLGPTDPEEGREWQIRYALRGTHRIFNLVHASDNPDRALEEGLVLFEKSRIYKIAGSLRRKTIENNDSIISRLIAELDTSQSAVSLPLDLRMSNLRYSVKAKLLDLPQLRDITVHSEEVRDCFLRLQHLSGQEKSIVGLNLSLRKEYQEMAQVLKEQRTVSSLLLRVGRSLPKPFLELISNWVIAFQVLADNDALIRSDFGEFSDILEDLGVELDRPTRIALQSAWICYFHASFHEDVSGPLIQAENEHKGCKER
jgi:nucleoside diphosphate kinase